MVPTKESVTSETSTPRGPRKRPTTTKAPRTPRACDRCRFKKSKCDGHQPCKNCSFNDRACIYSIRRRRDARNWYCGMQDTVDEAMKRLYEACKHANSFPGTLPSEQDGYVTTEAIIQGLGLSTLPPPIGTLPQDNPSVSHSQLTNKVSLSPESKENPPHQSQLTQPPPPPPPPPPALNPHESLEMCDQFHAALTQHRRSSSSMTSSFPPTTSLTNSSISPPWPPNGASIPHSPITPQYSTFQESSALQYMLDLDGMMFAPQPMPSYSLGPHVEGKDWAYASQCDARGIPYRAVQ